MGAVLFHGVLNVVLSAQNGLDDNIVSPRPQQIHIDTHLLQMAAEGSERPFVAKVILLTVLVLDKFIIFLID